MQTFLGLAALVWAFSGVVIYVAAKSAIHEILAVMLLSNAVFFIAMIGVLNRLDVKKQKQEAVS